MKIQVQQKDIAKVISTSCAVAEDILVGPKIISIKTVPEGIEVSAMNDTTALKHFLRVKVIEQGEILVEAHLLSKIIKTINEGSIIIKDQAGMIYIEAIGVFRINKLAVNNLINKSFDKQFENCQDNTIDDANIGICSFNLSKSDLQNLIKATKFSISPQESRANLHSLGLKINPSKLTAYSSDGHRLSVFELATQVKHVSASTPNLSQDLQTLANTLSDKGILISVKTIDYISSIASALDISTINWNVNENNSITLKFFKVYEHTSTTGHDQLVNDGNTASLECVLTSRLINAEPINCERIIPKNNTFNFTIRIEASILHESIARVTAVSSEKHKILKMSLYQNGYLKLTSPGINGALATEVVKCEILHAVGQQIDTLKQEQNRENQIQSDYLDHNLLEAMLSSNNLLIEIGFNYRYILDVMDVVKQHKVLINLQDPKSMASITLENASYNGLFLIMPISIAA